MDQGRKEISPKNNRQPMKPERITNKKDTHQPESRSKIGKPFVLLKKNKDLRE